MVIDPPMADGAWGLPEPGWEGEALFPFNADVLPVPVVSRISSSGGSAAGGAEVTISGENFAELRSVAFGSTPARYTVDSESKLTVVVPASSAGGSVPVTVVTAAGSAEAPGGYTYDVPPVPPSTAPESCVVPVLKWRRLRAVRNVLSWSDCQLGQVRKRRHTTVRRGLVKRQEPPAGTVLPAGAKVAVALGMDPTRHGKQE
jgi:hypothetical protein